MTDYNIKTMEEWDDEDKSTYRKIIRHLDQVMIYSSDLFNWDSGVLAGVAGFVTGVIFESKFIRFRVNPEKVRISRSKIRSTQKTKGGFETFYWGENMVDVRMESNTAWLRPYEFLVKRLGMDDYRFGSGFLWLQEFEKFFKKSEEDGVYLNMVYDNTLFRGHLNDLNYNRDADNIWQIPFSFSLSCYPDKIHTLTSIIPGLTGIAGLVGSFSDVDDI